MHVFKKSDLCFPAIVPLLLSAMLLCPGVGIAQSSGIRIESFSNVINQGVMHVSAEISYELSEETRDALDQGVALEFDVIFRVRKKRQWLWDTVVTEKMLSYRVEHQPLSGHYLVTELNNGRRHQYRTLVSALQFIGNIDAFPLVDTEMLYQQYRYTVQVMAELNIQSLPAPLRPLAYLSSQWHLASPWRNLDIKL